MSIETEKLNAIVASIRKPDESAEKAAAARWLDLCKPLFALGELEKLVIRLAGVQNRARPAIQRKAIAIFAADNGVVNQGVTQVGQEVTAAVTYNFTRGITTVNAMARISGADLFPVDVGINQPGRIPGVIDRRVRDGTADLSVGPAMEREEAIQAILHGAGIAQWLGKEGYELLGTGEMGIGNTTTSSAVLSILTAHPVEVVTGRGAGLSDEKLLHKQAIIRQGIEINQPDPNDPIDVLHKVGGLDLAALTGYYLGCAAARLPVVVDGFIAGVAALAAIRLAPAVRPYIFPSHISAEPGARLALDAIGLPAWFTCRMCVGEGTGCCVAFSLFDHALAAFDEIATWDEAGVGAYVPQSETPS